MNYLVDVNVWLAMTLVGHVYQNAAAEWFQGQRTNSMAFCRVTQAGLLRLLTNPKVMGPNVVTPAEAWSLYERFHEDSRVEFLVEPPGIERAWRGQTRSQPRGHNFWTDAYLAGSPQPPV
jgi:uncharacterized protein